MKEGVPISLAPDESKLRDATKGKRRGEKVKMELSQSIKKNIQEHTKA